MASSPTHHLILSPTWEGARKDSHLTEEETEAQRGEWVSTLPPRRLRAGRRDLGWGSRALSPTSAWTVSAQTPSFFATNILGELIPPSLWRRNPLFGLLALVPSAVLPTESLLKMPGLGRKTARAGGTLGGKEGRPAITGRDGSRRLTLRVRDDVAAEHRGPGMPGPGHGLFLWALGSLRKT